MCQCPKPCKVHHQVLSSFSMFHIFVYFCHAFDTHLPTYIHLPTHPPTPPNTKAIPVESTPTSKQKNHAASTDSTDRAPRRRNPRLRLTPNLLALRLDVAEVSHEILLRPNIRSAAPPRSKGFRRKRWGRVGETSPMRWGVDQSAGSSPECKALGSIDRVCIGPGNGIDPRSPH